MAFGAGHHVPTAPVGRMHPADQVVPAEDIKGAVDGDAADVGADDLRLLEKCLGGQTLVA